MSAASAIQAPLQRDADLREQNERLKTSLDRAAIDVANLQTELTAALRRETMLERQIATINNKQVPATDIDEVFDHFLAVVWSGKGRKPKLDDAKRRLIRGRLKDGFSVAELKRAVAGLAKRPNVGDKGRCGPGEGRRYANLVHALRDADTVDRFIDYLDNESARAPGSNVVPLKRERQTEPRSGEDLCDALTDMGLSVHARHGYGATRWMAQCPAHDDRGPSLSITELNDGRVLAHCFAGCPTDDVLAAVGWSFGMLRGRA